MSVENVKKFFKKAISNKILGQKLEKIKDELQNPSIDFTNYEHIINTKIIPIAEEVGLNFTTKDFLDYVGEISHELDEKDLLNVSGGFSANKSIAALGILLTFAPFAPNFAAIAEDVNKVQGSNQQPSTSIVQTTKNQPVAQYKQFKPSKLISLAPTIFGGKSITEQIKDNLVNFLKKNNISTLAQLNELLDQLDAPSKENLSKDLLQIGSLLVENTINNNYYVDGTVPDENQANELNLVHKWHLTQKNEATKWLNINFKNLNLNSETTFEDFSPNQNADVNKGTGPSLKKTALEIADKELSKGQISDINTTSRADSTSESILAEDTQIISDENPSLKDHSIDQVSGINDTTNATLENIGSDFETTNKTLDDLIEHLNQINSEKVESKREFETAADASDKETLSSDIVNLGTENNRNNERTEKISTPPETKSTTSIAKNAAEASDGTSKKAIVIDKTTTIEAGSKSTEAAATESAEASSVVTTAKSKSNESAALANSVVATSESKSTETATPVNTEVTKTAANNTAKPTALSTTTQSRTLKLSLNTLKEAVNYIFGGNIDESKTPSKQTYGNEIEIIYGWDQNNKPFALNSDGVVFSYNNGTAGGTLQQKLPSDKILELNNAENAAEEAAAKAKTEAEETTKAKVEAEITTKSEGEPESNTDEVSSTDDSASKTNESSKAEEKFFYSASQFSSWEDNGDGTVTAVDKDGETHTFFRYDSSAYNNGKQTEQLTILANTIEKTVNSSFPAGEIWPENREDFWENLTSFIGKTYNAKTKKLEVDGVSEDDPRVLTILDFCRKYNIELKVDYTSSLVDTMEKIDSDNDLSGRTKNAFLDDTKRFACSKEFNTVSGMAVLPEDAPDKDKKDLARVKDFYNNNISNYNKFESYFKLNKNASEKEVVANWLNTANKVPSVDYISTGKSNFIVDGCKIAASLKYSYENGEIYYTIPGIPQNEVDNFVKAFDLLGLSKNVEHSSTNSNNPKELRANLEKTTEEANSNILNIQKESRVQFIKDLRKLSDLEKQDDNEET